MAALRAALAALERLAPARLAAKWDNVGLLVDHGVEHQGEVFRVLLTNDLTLPVVREAVARRADLVVAYHPTPFAGLKRLAAAPAEASAPAAARAVLLCARHGVAVFSPHTSWDAAAPGGLNDWLLQGVLDAVAAARGRGAAAGPGRPLFAARRPLAPAENRDDAAAGAGDGRTARAEPLGAGAGAGAGGDAASPVTLAEVVAAVKAHLGLQHVQLALPQAPLGGAGAGADEEGAGGANARAAAAGAAAVAERSACTPVAGVSVCAGSGAGLLARVLEAARPRPRSAGGSPLAAPPAGACHVFVTGEMSHHEVLAATAAGVAVVLTTHSRCERGFLRVAGARLEALLAEAAAAAAAAGAALPRFEIMHAELDADPLTVQ